MAELEKFSMLIGGKAVAALSGKTFASQNPYTGEAWAETYRGMNGSRERWDSTSDSFFPDGQALDLARRDVLNPYDGGEYVDRSGRFRAHGSRWRQFTVPVENDGTVDLRLRGQGSLDADLYIYARPGTSKPLAKATHYGHGEHLRQTFCGYRHVTVYAYRNRGSGSFKLRLTLPFFASG